MKKLFLVLVLSILILNNTGFSAAYRKTDYPTISWGKIDPLVLTGIPSEIKYGKVSFVIGAKSDFRQFNLIITGGCFRNGNFTIETEYQADGGVDWYKAGEPFMVICRLGEMKSIRYRVFSGPKISSQQSGEYTADVTYIISSL